MRVSFTSTARGRAYHPGGNTMQGMTKWQVKIETWISVEAENETDARERVRRIGTGGVIELLNEQALDFNASTVEPFDAERLAMVQQWRLAWPQRGEGA